MGAAQHTTHVPARASSHRRGAGGALLATSASPLVHIASAAATSRLSIRRISRVIAGHVHLQSHSRVKLSHRAREVRHAHQALTLGRAQLGLLGVRAGGTALLPLRACARCGACSMRAARARALRARAEAAIAISRGAACGSERLGARARRWRARGNAPARNAPARAGKLPARIAEKKVQLDCGKKGEFQLRARVRADPWLVGWWVGWVGWVVGRSVKLPTESESTRSPALQ